MAIIATERRNAAASGMADQREFTIKAGAHIMSVLSGLYTNPVDAMVREYMSNMYDAWIALRRINPTAEYVPCELHLPTSLEPVLVFKDYGCGMSYDRVWNVYSQYGNSTKGDNNEEVGGFGLGSKTAFCYNNGQQWTIESRYNGEHMTFMAYVGSDGIPQLTHVATWPTTERNGVTIRIPIQRNDINAAHNAAARYVPYFPMDITVVNAIKQLTKPAYTFRGASWGVSPTASYMLTSLNVIMGNVPYSITRDYAMPDMYYAMPDMWRNLNAHIDLYVPIGSVDIVPSRDNLKYTERTKNVITAALKSAWSELGDLLTKEMRDYDTPWQVRSRINEIANASDSLLKMLPKVVAYRGGGVYTQPKDDSRFAAVSFARYENGSMGVRTHTFTADTLVTADANATMQTFYIASSSKSEPATVAGLGWMHVDNKYCVVMIADDKNSERVARGWINTHCVARSHNGRKLRYGHKLGAVTLITTQLAPAKVAELLGGIPVDRVITASSVSGKVKIAKGDRGNVAVYRYSNGRFDARAKVPDKLDVAYYVPMVKDDVTGRYVFRHENNLSMYDLFVMWCVVEGSDFTGNLYGIRADDIATVTTKNGTTKWINFMDTLRTSAARYLKQHEANITRFVLGTAGNELTPKILVQNTYNFLTMTCGYNVNELRTIDGLSDLVEYRSAQIEHDNKRSIPHHTIISMVNMQPMAFTLETPKQTAQSIMNDLQQKYPMIYLLATERNIHPNHANNIVSKIEARAIVKSYIASRA